MVSMRCLRSVGLFSSTKEIPACAATSRKRMGGGATAAAASSAEQTTIQAAALVLGRGNLRLPRHFRLGFLLPFDDLLVLSHGCLGLLRVAGRPIGAGQLKV